MNIKSFFVAALTSALELGIGTPDDVLAHVTPDVLAANLPRPLWARLLTAALGAPKVDAQLVIETLGVSNLCEHVPAQTIWLCIETIAARSLGGAVAATSSMIAPASPPPPARPLQVSAPPPPDEKKKPAAATPVPAGPSIPAPSTAADDFTSSDDAAPGSPLRPRTATGQRFRQTNTNIGRLASTSQRRPQAAVPTPTPEPAAPIPHVRRGLTESDFEMETAVGGVAGAGADDWKNALAVEDEQLVDWATSEETQTATSETDSKLGRKR